MDVLVLACETASGFMRTLSLKRKNHVAGRSASGWKEAHVATDFRDREVEQFVLRFRFSSTNTIRQ